jgi:hypothetical protein
MFDNVDTEISNVHHSVCLIPPMRFFRGRLSLHPLGRPVVCLSSSVRRWVEVLSFPRPCTVWPYFYGLILVESGMRLRRILRGETAAMRWQCSAPVTWGHERGIQTEFGSKTLSEAYILKVKSKSLKTRSVPSKRNGGTGPNHFEYKYHESKRHRLASKTVSKGSLSNCASAWHVM